MKLNIAGFMIQDMTLFSYIIFIISSFLFVSIDGFNILFVILLLYDKWFPCKTSTVLNLFSFFLIWLKHHIFRYSTDLLVVKRITFVISYLIISLLININSMEAKWNPVSLTLVSFHITMNCNNTVTALTAYERHSKSNS